MSLPPTCLFLTTKNAAGDIDMVYVGSREKLNKVDKRGHLAPLHMAAQWTSGARIQELIALGAVIEVRGDKTAGNITPLFSAACHCNISALDALLLAGADVTARDSNGRTALMYTVNPFENQQHSLACARKLVAAGVPLNAQNEGGGTALAFAVEVQNVEVVAFLLECGADQNIPLNDGWTPLYTACTKKNHALMELLLACPGTNVDAQTKALQATALHHAAFQNDIEMIYMLLAANANPRVGNVVGAWPHRCATAAGHSLAAAILAVYSTDLLFDEALVVQEDGTLLNMPGEVRKRTERLALARQKLQNAKNNRVLRLQVGCEVCKEPTTNSCSACRRVFYCSAACQQNDWRAHKKQCKKTNESAK